jgi:DNA integrity scanning protein DisA with diadenylate cyclase activity
MAMVLAELDYARHPHAHEGVAPRYGALLSSSEVLTADRVGPVERVDVGDIPLSGVRRLADGRSSFVARTVRGPARLVCFDRTREYESSAVHLAVATGAVVVQRLGRGWVRLCTPQGVATWDGTHWSAKSLSSDVAERVGRIIPAAAPAVLVNLVELCMHWLGAGRVGAAFVWRLDGDPRDLTHLGLAAAVSIPELDLTRRTHFAPLLNALAQYDRATLVDPHGRVATVGVHLRSSEKTRRELSPFRGTRHTSALRFSGDEPSAVVFVVSSGGTLSIFWNGRRLDTD